MAAASPPGPPRVWTVEGPEGEEIQSPIFGVNDAPALSLADALAAARALCPDLESRVWTYDLHIIIK
eukprot:gene510-23940_t